VKEGYEVVIVGDTNSECDLHNDEFVQLYSLLTLYNISNCDDFVTGNNQRAVTYVNDALGWVTVLLLITCLHLIQLGNISCPG